MAGMRLSRGRARPAVPAVPVGMAALTAMAGLVAPGVMVEPVWRVLMGPSRVRRGRPVVAVAMAARAVLVDPAAELSAMVVPAVLAARAVRVVSAVMARPGGMVLRETLMG